MWLCENLMKPKVFFISYVIGIIIDGIENFLPFRFLSDDTKSHFDAFFGSHKEEWYVLREANDIFLTNEHTQYPIEILSQHRCSNTLTMWCDVFGRKGELPTKINKMSKREKDFFWCFCYDAMLVCWINKKFSLSLDSKWNESFASVYVDK